MSGFWRWVPLLTKNLSGRKLRPYINFGLFLSGLDTAETPKLLNPDLDTTFSATIGGPRGISRIQGAMAVHTAVMHNPR